MGRDTSRLPGVRHDALPHMRPAACRERGEPVRHDERRRAAMRRVA